MNFNSKIFENNKNISLDNFINKALYDLEYGFYMKKNPIGANGDFITSPNISILFSEMLAIWCISFLEKIRVSQKSNHCRNRTRRWVTFFGLNKNFL